MIIHDFDMKYAAHEKDESRHCGYFDKITFPTTTQELVDAIIYFSTNNIPYTIQGARTGISGACVPHGGAVISTEKLCNIGELVLSGEYAYIDIDSGARLENINQFVSQKGFSFLPSPTEATATIGGLYACKSCGINNYKYPNLTSFIIGAECILPDGSVWNIQRGQYVFSEYGCPLPNGKTLKIKKYPSKSFHMAFCPKPGDDLLDLFAGSEGTLVTISKLRLLLAKKEVEPWGIIFFFDCMDGAIQLITEAYHLDKQLSDESHKFSFMEFFDKNSLELLMQYQDKISKLKEIPKIPATHDAAVYIELSNMEPDIAEERLIQLLDIFENIGGREENTWAAYGENETMRFRSFRHSLPEAINSRIDICRNDFPDAYKMCIDITVPMGKLINYINMFETEIDNADLEGYVFGHGAEGRFHINIVPKCTNDIQAGLTLFNKWTALVIKDGGCILSENGIGKTKRDFFESIITEDELSLMKQLKNYFDPQHILNPGNIFRSK